MRKLIGWVQVVLCSILFLIGLFFLLIVLSPDDEEGLKLTQYTTWNVTVIVVIALLLVVGLTNGFKAIKKKKVTEIVKYEKELNINISGKIKYRDFRNLILGVIFRSPRYWIVPVVIAVYLIFIFTFTNDTSVDKRSNYITAFLFVIILIFRPIITFIKYNRIFKVNKLYNEHLAYSLNNESINIKGETIDKTLKWTYFFKIKESKNFFVLYQGGTLEALLDKKMFSENELAEFRQFAKSLNVKLE